MTFEIGLVLGILAAAIILFVTEWVRVDVVALMVLAVLAITELITPEQALSGFSNPAVITVWAVFILSAGLARTGVAGMIGRRVLLLAGSGEVRLIALIMATAAFLSAFMNNVGVAALLLPVVMDIAKRTRRAPSRLLIPLASACLLGGLTTLIGTPPNLLVAEALTESGLGDFSMFDFAPVGLAVVAGGILYMTLFGRHLLPTHNPRGEGADGENLPRLYELGTDLSFVHLPPDSSFDGETLATSRLGSSLGIDVVGIFRRDHSELAPGPDSVLRAGDRLLVRGALDVLSSLGGDEFLDFEDENLPVERLLSADILFAEVRCGSSSVFLGRTIRDLDFRNAHGAIVLAMERGDETLRTGLERRRILEGDVLLVQGTAEQLEALDMLPGVDVRYIDRADAFHLEQRLMAVRVPAGSALDGRSLEESQLGAAFGLGVMGILRDGRTHLMPGPAERLAAGDTLLVKGHRQSLASVEGLRGLEVEGEHPDPAALESDEIGLAEVALSPRTTLVGRTLRSLHFRDKYGLTVMAITRSGTVLRTGLRDLPLAFGDALLLYGSRRRLQVLAREHDFLVLTDQDREPVDLVRAPVATLIMASVVTAVLTGWLPIYIAAVAGAVLMVLTGCLTMDDAYRAIEWKAVFLIAGMLPMGIAMQETGAAEWITARSLSLIGGGSPLLIVAGLYIVTAVAAQVMPTSAVAILMAPIALNTAADLGLSPKALLMTVALSASASFMSPIAHPANVLIMGPGGYRFRDYFKVGLPMTLVCLTVVLLVLPLVWPLEL